MNILVNNNNIKDGYLKAAILPLPDSPSGRKHSFLPNPRAVSSRLGHKRTVDSGFKSKQLKHNAGRNHPPGHQKQQKRRDRPRQKQFNKINKCIDLSDEIFGYDKRIHVHNISWEWNWRQEVGWEIGSDLQDVCRLCHQSSLLQCILWIMQATEKVDNPIFLKKCN